MAGAETNLRQEQALQYAFRQKHPHLQFLQLKLAKWVTKNLADELGLPDSCDQCTSEELNSILTRCVVSDRRGDNLHTFHSVEFESDLY